MLAPREVSRRSGNRQRQAWLGPHLKVTTSSSRSSPDDRWSSVCDGMRMPHSSSAKQDAETSLPCPVAPFLPLPLAALLPPPIADAERSVRVIPQYPQLLAAPAPVGGAIQLQGPEQQHKPDVLAAAPAAWVRLSACTMRWAVSAGVASSAGEKGRGLRCNLRHVRAGRNASSFDTPVPVTTTRLSSQMTCTFRKGEAKPASVKSCRMAHRTLHSMPKGSRVARMQDPTGAAT